MAKQKRILHRPCQYIINKPKRHLGITALCVDSLAAPRLNYFEVANTKILTYKSFSTKSFPTVLL